MTARAAKARAKPGGAPLRVGGALPVAGWRSTKRRGSAAVVPELDVTKRPYFVLALVALLVLGGLAIWPPGDLAVARLFWSGGKFIGRGPNASTIRLVAWYLPFVVFAAFALAWLLAQARFWPVRFAPAGRSVLFLALTLALGPGLLVNGLLKEHSHRPRPGQTAEFNGPWAFRPFYRFDGACKTNCSFASGETASAFWLVAPASLAPPPYRPAAVAAALVFGAGVAILRMAFGGHYLSDVLAAALLTLAIVAATRRILWPRSRR